MINNFVEEISKSITEKLGKSAGFDLISPLSHISSPFAILSKELAKSAGFDLIFPLNHVSSPFASLSKELAKSAGFDLISPLSHVSSPFASLSKELAKSQGWITPKNSFVNISKNLSDTLAKIREPYSQTLTGYFNSIQPISNVISEIVENQQEINEIFKKTIGDSFNFQSAFDKSFIDLNNELVNNEEINNEDLEIVKDVFKKTVLESNEEENPINFVFNFHININNAASNVKNLSLSDKLKEIINILAAVCTILTFIIVMINYILNDDDNQIDKVATEEVLNSTFNQEINIEFGKELLATSNVNIRYKRSENSKFLGRVPIGIKVKVLKKYVKWALIEYFDKKNSTYIRGYVHLDYLDEL